MTLQAKSRDNNDHRDHNVLDENDKYYQNLPPPWNRLPRRQGRPNDEYKRAEGVPVFDGSHVEYPRWRPKAIQLIVQAYMTPMNKVILLQKKLNPAKEPLLQTAKDATFDAEGLHTMISNLEMTFGGQEAISLTLFNDLYNLKKVDIRDPRAVKLLMQKMIQIRDYFSNEFDGQETVGFQTNVNSSEVFRNIALRNIDIKNVQKLDEYISKHDLERNFMAILSWLDFIERHQRLTVLLGRVSGSEKAVVHTACHKEKEDKEEVDEVAAHARPATGASTNSRHVAYAISDYNPPSVENGSALELTYQSDASTDMNDEAVLQEWFPEQFTFLVSEETKESDEEPQPLNQEEEATFYGSRSTGTVGKYLVPTCDICHENHPYVRCDKYEKMTGIERVKHMFDAKRCLNCYRQGHMASKCPNRSVCAVCQQKHHHMLHDGLSEMREKSGSGQPYRDSSTGQTRGGSSFRSRGNFGGGGSPASSRGNFRGRGGYQS
jgi:hypothetical protein